MTDLIFVTNQLGAIRREERNGRRFIVAPAVAIVEGVLNGELVPAEEFGRYVDSWAGRPIPIGHPQRNGQYVTANRLDVHSVGRVFNPHLDDNKLKLEMWFDETALEAAGSDGEALRAKLEANETVEISTAYFRDLERTSGAHNGRRYEGVARNLRPDHVAVLLDTSGACSVRDGCGVPRINEEEDMAHTNVLTANQDLSFDDIVALLRTAIEEMEDGYVWVADVFPDDGFVVYEVESDEGDSQLFRRSYDLGENGEVTLGEATEVYRKKTYVEVDSASREEEQPASNERQIESIVTRVLRTLGIGTGFKTNKEKNGMDEIIDKLVANERCPFDREELEGFDEGRINGLAALLEQEPTPAANDGEPDEGDPASRESDESPEAAADVPEWARGLQQSISDLAGEVKELKANANAAAAKEKSSIVGRLTANERCPLSKTQLQAMDLEALKALDASYRPADYSGLGGVRANDDGALIEAPMPALANGAGKGGE